MQDSLNVCRISWAATALLLVTGATLPADAQDRSNSSSGLEEIIVTARKVEESLQTVPVSVTAFTAEAIRRQRIEGIADLALYTPGLVYQDINGTLSLPVIRGLAQTNIASDNNVGMFLNGVYLSNNRTLDIGLVDLERIEVIKGPQSALYGQNSFAGAINYVTRRPTDTFSASLEGSLGADELAEFSASASGPISETLSGSVSLAYREFDGTFDNQNPNTDDKLQGYQSTGISGTLEFAPNDRFAARLFGYHVDLENELTAQYLVPNNCGVSAFGTPTFFCGEIPTNGTFDLNTDGTFGRDAKNTIVSLDLDYEISPSWMVRSITALVESESASYFDFDYTSAGVPFGTIDLLSGESGSVLTNTFLGQGFSDFSDTSQELRLEYSNDRLDAMVGLYYFDSDRENGSFGAVDTGPLGPNQAFSSFIAFLFGTDNPTGAPIASNATEQNVRTTAAFGRVGYQATDKLRLSAELRWAEDRLEINRIINFTRPVTNNARQSDTFDSVTPRITADYQLSDDVLVYGVYAEGVRSGGFNANATIDSEQSYDQEENQTWEVGVKSQWLDRRLTLNGALYQIDWENMQINSRSVDPDNIFAVVRNTGAATSKGIELEASLLVNDHLLIGGTYAYNDPEFDAGAVDLGLGGLCGVDNSICPNGTSIGGQQLGRTVKTSYSAYVQANGELTSAWNWFARADFAYKDRQPATAINVSFLPEYSIVNTRFGIQNDRYEISLWAKNLFDEEYLTASSAQPRFHVGTITDTTFGFGRMWGLTAVARFGQ